MTRITKNREYLDLVDDFFYPTGQYDNDQCRFNNIIERIIT